MKFEVISSVGRESVLSNNAWSFLCESEHEFEVQTAINSFKDVLKRDGSVLILMADGSSVMRRIDREAELRALVDEVNVVRQAAGLKPIDG